jgi:hypothetical protein
MIKKTLLATSTTTLPAVHLPDVSPLSSAMLAQLTAALGVSRELLAADGQIEHVWSQLPRLIKRIPPALFDAAINYVWNAGRHFQPTLGSARMA